MPMIELQRLIPEAADFGCVKRATSGKLSSRYQESSGKGKKPWRAGDTRGSLCGSVWRDWKIGYFHP
jgi:hypothetical protein